MKFAIREGIIEQAWKLKKDRDALRTELENRIRTFGDKGDLIGEEIEELNGLKRELCAVQKATETIRLYKAKCNWAMYGGKPNKFFFNLEKKRKYEKNITQIYDKKGQLVTNSKDILEVQKEYFQEVYQAKVDNPEDPDRFSSERTVTLDELDKETLDLPFSQDELLAALKDMSLNKCPGSDGLSVEFYRKFWGELSQPLLQCL